MKLAPPMIVRRVACAGAVALTTLATTSPCRADEPAERDVASTANKEKARERYAQGAAAFQRGRYKDAIDLFLEADRLAPSAALSFNIARAYEKLGDDAAALRWYRDYLERADQPEDAAEVGRIVQRLEARLQAKGIQQMTVSSAPRGATVVVDGDPVGVTPWTGELAPGAHEVTLSLRGYKDARQQVQLPVDDALDVVVRLSPETPQREPMSPRASAVEPVVAPAATSSPRPHYEESGFDWRVAGWVSVGAGVAALGGATVFEILRRQAEDDARKETTQTRYAELVDTMESRRDIARVLAGVGGGLALTGVVILAVDAGWFSGGSSTEVSVACGPGACGATAHGAF